MSSSDRLAATRDKLEEAKYFLGLWASATSLDEAKYLLSALMSASRSITWVLQSELRAVGTDDFNVWWESKRAALSTELFSFRLLSLTRNTLVKEGNIAPLLDVSTELEDCTIVTRWDQTKGQMGCQSITSIFKPGQGPSVMVQMPLDEIAKVPAGHICPPEVEASLLDQLASKMIAVPEKLAVAKVAGTPTEIRYYFPADGRTRTKYELHSLFDGYLSRVQALVDDAAKQEWMVNSK